MSGYIATDPARGEVIERHPVMNEADLEGPADRVAVT